MNDTSSICTIFIYKISIIPNSVVKKYFNQKQNLSKSKLATFIRAYRVSLFGDLMT